MSENLRGDFFWTHTVDPASLYYYLSSCYNIIYSAHTDTAVSSMGGCGWSKDAKVNLLFRQVRCIVQML